MSLSREALSLLGGSHQADPDEGFSLIGGAGASTGNAGIFGFSGPITSTAAVPLSRWCDGIGKGTFFIAFVVVSDPFADVA